MNLHCSQTKISRMIHGMVFDIPMNLHCSQTLQGKYLLRRLFDIPMNLHCSQTLWHDLENERRLIFLWIYTALKLAVIALAAILVWYSYEFTLLSNRFLLFGFPISVWYSYEFTLLSNNSFNQPSFHLFDIPMNLHCSQTLSILLPL